jgi:hypothetical protein
LRGGEGEGEAFDVGGDLGGGGEGQGGEGGEGEGCGGEDGSAGFVVVGCGGDGEAEEAGGGSPDDGAVEQFSCHR